MTDIGDPQEEYKDLSENMRHYANMRFAQLTIFVAITGGLAAWFDNARSASDPDVMIVIAVVGTFIALVFLVMETRSASYWLHFKDRAVELEKQLGYCQYTRAPKRGLITATNVTRVFHVGTLLFWIVAAVAAPRLV